jgi:hypothetical protein
MGAQRNGLKLGSRDCNVVVTLQRVLQANEEFLIRVYLADAEIDDLLVLLQEWKATAGAGSSEQKLPIQNVANGPVIGYALPMNTSKILTKLESTSQNLDVMIAVSLEIVYKQGSPYRTPPQVLATNAPAGWVVTN